MSPPPTGIIYCGDFDWGRRTILFYYLSDIFHLRTVSHFAFQRTSQKMAAYAHDAITSLYEIIEHYIFTSIISATLVIKSTYRFIRMGFTYAVVENAIAVGDMPTRVRILLRVLCAQKWNALSAPSRRAASSVNVVDELHAEPLIKPRRQKRLKALLPSWCLVARYITCSRRIAEWSE